MKDFAAIDFETANYNRHSICSIGIIIVRDGQVCDSIYELVRPTPNYYSHQNTQVHGLTKDDTDPAEHFPEVWSRIVDRLEGLTLVAHNSPFDSSCLKKVYEHYDMPYPEFEFLCTLRASRKAFPYLENHKLPTVARECGYDLTQHHNALADAEACAHIALQIL